MRHALTTIAIKKAGDGKLQDGGGLILVKKGATGKWVFRYSHLGRRREMGLGPWPTLSLADARAARDAWSKELAAGRDPIDVRTEQQADAVAQRDRDDPTFADLVTLVFKARQDSLKRGGEAGRWRSPLDVHVLPKLGCKRVSELRQIDIKDVLAPIWRQKHRTAEKAIQRITITLRDGQRMGYPCDPLIAESAKVMLGTVQHKTKHIASTPWQDIPALYKRLQDGTTSSACLRFMILTLVRLDGCAGAMVTEEKDGVWTVPPERLKGLEGRTPEFRVPLSTPALEHFIDAQEHGDTLLFPGKRGLTPITSTALAKRLNEIGEAGRPHGFRSSFRTWVQEKDSCPWDVAETILGHSIGGKVERTYARSDILERRQPVMEAWASFVTGQTQM